MLIWVLILNRVLQQFTALAAMAICITIASIGIIDDPMDYTGDTTAPSPVASHLNTLQTHPHQDAMCIAISVTAVTVTIDAQYWNTYRYASTPAVRWLP